MSYDEVKKIEYENKKKNAYIRSYANGVALAEAAAALAVAAGEALRLRCSLATSSDQSATEPKELVDNVRGNSSVPMRALIQNYPRVAPN